MRSCRLLPLLPAFACLLAGPALGRTLLRNDGFEPGDAVAFYTRIGQEESFAAIYTVPDDHPVYRICRVLLFVGPDGFNIYTVRFGVADVDGGELGAGEHLIWQSDLDAFQVPGSRDRMSAIDLSAEGIVADTRDLRLQLRVESSERSPNIATDADGITPGRNYVRVLQRNGQTFRGFTEGMDPEGSPPRPPGDWILRVEIAHPDEPCPGVDDPVADAGPPDDVFDMGSGEDDLGLDGGDEVFDMGSSIDPDAGPGDRDAGVEPPPDAGEPVDRGGMVSGDDAGIEPDRGGAPDRGGPLDGDPLELTRIVPERGPADRNTEVVINGRGFLDGGGVIRAELGEDRLLEAMALSGSTLSAIVPAGLLAGAHDLRIHRADGQVAVLPAAFTIAGDGPPPLSLRHVEPDVIAEGAPAELTVRGDGFTADTAFSIGGAPLEDVVIDPDGAEARGTLLVELTEGRYDVVARRDGEVARLEAALTVERRRGPAADGCRAAPGTGGSAPLGLALLLALGGVIRWRPR